MKEGRKTHLALKELKRGTSTSADMAELIFSAVLSDNGGGITTTDNNSSTLLGSFDGSVEKRLGALSEFGELEDTGGTREVLYYFAMRKDI